MSDPLAILFDRIHYRAAGGDTEQSYTAQLLSKGRTKVVEKFGEEAVELIIAATQGDKRHTISESADLLYHWLVLLADQGISLEDIWTELQLREQQSGLQEKASR